MAYSSVITMCGGKSVYMAQTQNNWVSYIPVALALLILLLLIKNYRDFRSIIALIIAILGTSGIVGVHQVIMPPVFYNIGASFLFFAIWLNGSFLSFIAHLFNWIKRRSKSVEALYDKSKIYVSTQ